MKFTYHINLDERGEFYADVRNANDTTVFEIRTPDGENNNIFEDGYMRNKTDTMGLQKYLRQIGVMQKEDFLIDESSSVEYAEGGGVGKNVEIILTENRPNGAKWRGVVKPFMLKSIEKNQYSGGFKRYEIEIYDEVEREPTKNEMEKANDFFDKVGGRYSNGGGVGFKSGDKVTDGRGNVGIIKKVQQNGSLYIQWLSFSGEPTNDLTADNNPNDFEKLDEYSKGGDIGDESVQMVSSQAKEAKHHADELHNVLKGEKHLDPWVVAKMERATTDLSDVTHYIDGKKEYAKGGGVGLKYDWTKKPDENGYVYITYTDGTIVPDKEIPNNLGYGKVKNKFDFKRTTKYQSDLSLKDAIFIVQKMNEKYAKGGGVGKDYYVVTFGFNGDEGYQVAKSKPIYAESDDEAVVMLKDQFESYEGMECYVMKVEKLNKKLANGGTMSSQPNVHTYTGQGSLMKYQKDRIENVSTYVAPNGTNLELVTMTDPDSSTGMMYAILVNGRGLWATSYRDKAKEYYNEEMERYKQTYALGGRTKSALMRDRAYKSSEPWELNYNRKTRPKNPHYSRYDDGGLIRDKSKNDFMSMFNWYLDNNETPVSKGMLMDMAYPSTASVDSSFPASLMSEVDNQMFFVYDYTENKTFGTLVDLREKLKYSNVPVNLTIVKNGELMYGNDLPDELIGASFHKALNYVFNNDDVSMFNIVPKSDKYYAEGGGVNQYRRGGVMGDVYSIQNNKQFKQLITVYNELSNKFGVVNYFLDHNDNSVVFLMYGDDETLKDTIKLQKYVDTLSERGFDVFDKYKNKNIIIENDNSQGGGYVYFKLKLSDIVRYAEGGGVGSPAQWIRSLNLSAFNDEAASMIKNEILTDPHLDDLSENDEFYVKFKNYVLTSVPKALEKAPAGAEPAPAVNELEELKARLRTLKKMADKKPKDEDLSARVRTMEKRIAMMEKSGKKMATGGGVGESAKPKMVRTIFEEEEFEYAGGGGVNWENVQIGDAALLKDANKLGVVMGIHDDMFLIQFADGTSSNHSADELMFIADDQYKEGGSMYMTAGDYRNELEEMSPEQLANAVNNELGISVSVEEVENNFNDYVNDLVSQYRQVMASRGEMGFAKGGSMGESAKPKMVRTIFEEEEYEYGKGGGMATFEQKVNAISDRLEGTKVSPKYRKKYGKTYSETEADEAAKNIAGAMRKKYGK